MKLGRLAFAALASAAMIALALAGCGNPSDGTVWHPPGEQQPPPPPPILPPTVCDCCGADCECEEPGDRGEPGCECGEADTGNVPSWLAGLGFPADTPLGVIDGDVPGPFVRAGGDTVVELTTQGLRVAPVVEWGGGLDLVAEEIDLSAGDTLTITVIGGPGTPSGQELFVQVHAGGPWAGQMLGDLVGITAGETSTWEHTLNAGDMNSINDNPPEGRLRIRLINPVEGNFIITAITVN